MTCLVAACFAASFHVIPLVVFSANGSITSETPTEVRPACTLSHQRILKSSSVPSFHLGMWLGSQPHTAIIAVWHFMLTVGQYVIISWDVKCFPEFYFEGTSHAFWCYLSVPQPEIYV